jgi:putative hydrolase of the HAD superfamily
VKALMVDVDGVIVVHPDPKGWSANLERDLGLKIEDLQAQFFEPNFHDIVHGRAALRDRLAPVLARIAPHLSCDELCAYWFEHDSHLDHGLLDQLAAVRAQGYALHLATVQEHERAAYLWNEMGLKDRFDAIHYAADLGHAKPADGFYAAIEARTGYAPGELFFIDDKVANVQAAQARGWKAALWTGRERLADLMAGA